MVKAESHYLAQAGPNSGSSYLSFPSAGIIGMSHHTQLNSTLQHHK
jgi:hypothetical protein